MSLEKSGVKEGNSRLQDSGLFGIIDKGTPRNHGKHTTVKFPVPFNYQARRLAVAAMLKTEYRKAQAITLIRQMSIK